ncbi:SDR family NAD(P)-dependent oxidoreductase [Pseudomonas aeruginosa]
MNDETSFNPFSLSGRRILVTGASSGLGLAIAQSCARMGAELIVTGRDQNPPGWMPDNLAVDLGAAAPCCPGRSSGSRGARCGGSGCRQRNPWTGA